MREIAIPIDLQRRKEDERLITGHAHYVDDVRLPEGRPAVLHMVVVRSSYAHARLQHIKLDAARAQPGVVAALAGADLGSDLRPLDISIPLPSLKKPDRLSLALDKVRYVGDPVAVVLAESLSKCKLSFHQTTSLNESFEVLFHFRDPLSWVIMLLILL